MSLSGTMRDRAHVLYRSQTDGDMSYSYLMHTSNDVVLQHVYIPFLLGPVRIKRVLFQLLQVV